MKILIIGETCRDEFVYGCCDRLCPEAPVPVFSPKNTQTNLGMANNVLQNVSNIFKYLSIDCQIDFISNNPQGSKMRYIDSTSNQMMLRIDTDSYAPIDQSILHDTNFDQYDAVIVSDYDKNFLSDLDLEYIARKSRLSFLDTKKDANINWMLLFDFIKINEKEYTENKFIDLHAACWHNTIITMASNGCRFKDQQYPLKQQVQVRDVTGAGDTFLAAFAAHFLAYKDDQSAIAFAQDCCSIVVQKKGVAVPFE